MGNETYVIKVESPLLRPGLSVTVSGVSERYLVKTMQGLMKYVRQYNNEEAKRVEEGQLEKKLE